jgi:hypothetical protein
MGFPTRLVLVLGFFGGLFLLALTWRELNPLVLLVPLGLAAIVVYPITWLFGGLR